MRTARRLLTGGAAPRPTRVLALVLLVTCFLAAAAPRVLEVLQTRVLRQTLAAAPSVVQTVSVTSGWVTTGKAGHGSYPPAAKLTATIPVLRNGSRPPLATLPGSAWTSVTSPIITVLNPASTARPGTKDPVLEFVYRNPVGSHLRLTAGVLPDHFSVATVDGRQRVPVMDVAVSVATAARFGLHPGSDIRLGPQPVNPNTGHLVERATGPPAAMLHVTGIVRPASPSSAFWTYDQLLAAPVLQAAFSDYPGPFWAGAVLIGPRELAALPSVFPGQQLSLLWDLPLRLSTMTAAEVPQAVAALHSLNVNLLANTAGAGYPLPLAIVGNPQAVLASFPAQESAADQVLSLTITGLFLIGMVLILLASRLIVERRDEELAALRARGSSLPGLALRILADTSALLVVSLIAGIAVAVVVSPGGSVVASWEMTALLGTAALGGPPLLAMIAHRDSAQSRRAARADVTIPRRSPRRTVAELSAVVLTVGVAAALRYRTPGGASGVNLVTGAAPQLVALLAACSQSAAIRRRSG
jgi:putative ABC transport system permease protein